LPRPQEEERVRQWDEPGILDLQSRGRKQWREEPDLLDSLIQQEQEERALTWPLVLPSLETLLKLLELQSASEEREVQGRAITGGRGCVLLTQAGLQEEQMKVIRNMAVLSPPSFPPINLKLPPPSHPPAVPASYSLYCQPYTHLSPPHPLPLHSPPPSPLPGSSSSLHYRLEETQLQLRALERERKRTEASLARRHPGLSRHALCSSLSAVVGGAPRLPPSPSRLDRLAVDSWREHGRVAALLERMAGLLGLTLHPGILQSVADWLDTVMALQGLRRGAAQEVEVDSGLADCSRAVRRVRTSLWAALQTSTLDTTKTEY
jgi:hypothetical protein